MFDFQTSADWLFICPEGFQDFLLYVKSKYQNPVILVTENGRYKAKKLVHGFYRRKSIYK